MTCAQAASLAALLAQYKLDETEHVSVELFQREALSFIEVEFYPATGDWARWRILDDGKRYIVQEHVR